MKPIKVKTTRHKIFCNKCKKKIFKGETYWPYGNGRNICKKCSHDLISQWIETYTTMLIALDCGPDKCLTCNRKIQCIV